MEILSLSIGRYKPLLLCSSIVFSVASFAGTVENFNSHTGAPVSTVRNVLQNNCWSFHHFDVNANGWNPALEGDGAMVASADAASFPNSGIYTPLLQVTDHINVSFVYTFSENFSVKNNRWLNICLATGNNDVLQVLEHIEFAGINATLKKNYSTSFGNIASSAYRLVLQYGGSGGSSRIAIDQLNISAPFKYPGGCNTAPIAGRDRTTGMPDRTATGSLLLNDKDTDQEKLTAYLIKGSPNGSVTLNENGTFVFAPNEGFKGNSTHFVYRICDAGAVNLCSANTTVTINFPDHPAPITHLTDFKGSYNSNGVVALAWKTKGKSIAQKFVVERSLDGRRWQSSGEVPAGDANNSNDYAYMDRLTKNTVQKNDLYYRLKQVYEDGSVATSRLLIVRVYNNKQLTMISVTPNPAKNDIAVNVQLQDQGRVAMRLMNNNGSPVIYKSEEAQQGLNSYMIDGSAQIQPGPYSLEVIVNSKERMVVKLIKE